MRSIISCITTEHDRGLLLAAVAICIVGVYGAFAVASHAARSHGGARRLWAGVSVVAAGCTAWATHMTALLAFRPGMRSGFEPLLTACSLLAAIAGIGVGVLLAVQRRDRAGLALAGCAVGLGVATLHYLGQAAYVVTGRVSWDLPLVALSVAASLGLSTLALVLAGERSRLRRRWAAPLLLASIAVLHLSGMTAATLTFDPRVALPADAVSPEWLAPLVALVSLGLLVLAVVGWRFALEARSRRARDRDRLRELANVALEGLLICSGERIEAVNLSAEQLIGVGRAELAGRLVSELLPDLSVLSLPDREEREGELLRPDGQRIPVRVLRSEVTLGGGRQTVVAVRDQRERLRTESAIRDLAFSDKLTGLPNRTRFHDLVEVHASSRRERDQGYALLMIDLDRFKLVNDTLGHAMGDRLLAKVSERLRSAVRERDVVARLGGDEFAVLQADVVDADDCRRLAARIVDLLGRPFLIDGHILNVGGSVGVALSSTDGGEAVEVLRNADLALYKAKADGKGAFRMFEPELDARMQARRSLEADLRRALALQEFELHYQPLVDTRSGRVTSAEALVRWRHPERGLVSPADFIPLAEETGLIVPLGLWVMRTACANAAAWPDGVRVAVNLSPVQFRDLRLAETVKGVLASSGLPADRLELEITEGVLLSDEARTLATLHSLRDAGVSISMDDFGTGYSSLSYLRRFPFDKIKIDQSFVRQLPGDAESAAIVRAILTLGACLGMSTTVEGVETPEQFAFTAAEGCDQVQGYHVSRPLPHDRLLSFLGVLEAA